MGLGAYLAGGDEVWGVRPGGGQLGNLWGVDPRDRFPLLCPAQARASHSPQLAAPSRETVQRFQALGAIRPTLDTQATVYVRCSSVVLLKQSSIDLARVVRSRLEVCR